MSYAEQRAMERVTTSMLGNVTFEERTVTCLIADFSSSGARLRISLNVLLPETFWLYAPQHWMTYRATLRWRNGEEVGVEFV